MKKEFVVNNKRNFASAFLAIVTSASITTGAWATELPVGDGHVSTSASRGNVFACNQNFRSGGARHTGDWFHDTTWDPDAKPHVQGKVTWPDATFSIKAQGDALAVKGNSLPVGSPTGTFPIAKDDPVYQYDTNPNPIKAQKLSFSIPLVPTKAAEPSCLSMGMIGFTTTGVALYNALDDAGRDAAAHEVQDLCDGHPQGKGQYHYHSGSPCLPNGDKNAVVGWALDGYPILGLKDASGKQITNKELDDCHGRSENVSVDGRSYDYAYRLTAEYPYIIGCFTGKIDQSTKQAIRKAMGPPRNGPGQK
jgi:YHYH protein